MAITLKQARLLSDLTQKEVAVKLGVHMQTYMKWEKSPEDMPVRKAKEVSQLFNRGVDEIFFDTIST